MTRFKLKMTHYEPGCGCGCEDNDLNIADQTYTKEFSFEGTREGAQKEIKSLEEWGAVPCYGNQWSIVELRVPDLLIVSGPSCTGKGPLIDAVQRYNDDISFNSINVIKSLESRPDGLRESDDPDYFMSSDQIRSLGDDYVVGECRGIPQAVKLDDLYSQDGLMLLEAYHTLGADVYTAVRQRCYDIETRSVFLSPLSMEETKRDDLESYLTGILMDKQMKRSIKGGRDIFSGNVIEDQVSRAMDAYSELKNAHKYSHVIVNHDGEGHPNWDQDPLVGDAARAVSILAEIVQNGYTDNSEHWTADSIK